MKRAFVSRAILHGIILLVALFWFLPTAGLLITSFRPAYLTSVSGWWTAFEHPFELSQFTLKNYREVLEQGSMARAFVNSLIVAIPSVILVLAVAAPAAYALAWTNLPGRKFMYCLVVGLIIVPLQMTFIPVLKLFNALGLSGTFPALWLAHTGYGLPFAIYLLHNFFASIPKGLIESASIDGASHSTIMLKIVIPLSLPALASLCIFQFLWVWNDLLVALIYAGGFRNVAPITLQVANLVGSRGQEWHLLTAAAFISMSLPLACFLAFQRAFVRGILAGSLKG